MALLFATFILTYLLVVVEQAAEEWSSFVYKKYKKLQNELALSDELADALIKNCRICYRQIIDFVDQIVEPSNPQLIEPTADVEPKVEPKVLLRWVENIDPPVE